MSIVFTEDRGAVRHVVLNRPEKRNAMNQELLLALRDALAQARDDSDVQCVVLRGEGPVFSAGVDIVELEPRLLQELREAHVAMAPEPSQLLDGKAGGGRHKAACRQCAVAIALIRSRKEHLERPPRPSVEWRVVA